MKIQFNKIYLLITALLFGIEVWIATVLKSGFIRHTFGDYLVVILLYCFIRGITDLSIKTSAFIVLIIAYSIETLQYFNVLALLNLENNTIAKLLLGSTFHIGDLIAYSLGVITVILIEKIVWKH